MNSILQEFFSLPDVLGSVGWMLAIAIFMGGFAWHNIRELKFWLIITLVFVVCSEYIRYLYLIGMGGEYTARPAFFILFTLVVYLVGMGIGIIIAWHIQRTTLENFNTLEMPEIAEVYSSMKSGTISKDLPDAINDVLQNEIKAVTKDRRCVSRQVTDVAIAAMFGTVDQSNIDVVEMK